MLAEKTPSNGRFPNAGGESSIQRLTPNVGGENSIQRQNPHAGGENSIQRQDFPNLLNLFFIKSHTSSYPRLILIKLNPNHFSFA